MAHYQFPTHQVYHFFPPAMIINVKSFLRTSSSERKSVNETLTFLSEDRLQSHLPFMQNRIKLAEEKKQLLIPYVASSAFPESTAAPFSNIKNNRPNETILGKL